MSCVPRYLNICSTTTFDYHLFSPTVQIEYETDELATSQSQQLVDTIHADVVVVGSGAGGGTVASELAKAGYSVLVLEKGGYFRREDFKEWEEPEAMLHLYEKGGLCASEDGNVVVLAGACVGGGTTVNWSASFRTPDYVRKDWVDEGLTAFRYSII